MQQSINRTPDNKRELVLFKRILEEQLERMNDLKPHEGEENYNNMIQELLNTILYLEENPQYSVMRTLTEHLTNT